MNIAFYTNYVYLDFFIESSAQSACVRCRSNEHEDILKKVILKLCSSLVPCVEENLLAAHIVLTLCVQGFAESTPSAWTVLLHSL